MNRFICHLETSFMSIMGDTNTHTLLKANSCYAMVHACVSAPVIANRFEREEKKNAQICRFSIWLHLQMHER